MKRLLGIAALMLMSTACEITVGNNGGVTVTPQSKINNFLTQLELNEPNVWDAKLVKHSQAADGYIVVSQEDTSGHIEYVAYDYADFSKGMNYSSYLASNPPYHNLRPDAYNDLFYFDGYNGTIVFEETDASSKDLEKVGAFIEAANVSRAGENLAAEFGLSEDRGLEIAKLANNWAKISRKRAMTSADADLFAKEVVGASLSEITNAYENAAEGNESGVESFLDKAAKKNGASPEQMGEIIDELFM